MFALEINVIPWVAKAWIIDRSFGVPLAKLPSLSSDAVVPDPSYSASMFANVALIPPEVLTLTP